VTRPLLTGVMTGQIAKPSHNPGHRRRIIPSALSTTKMTEEVVSLKITRELVDRLIGLKEDYDSRWPASTGKESFDIDDASNVEDTLEDMKLRGNDPARQKFYEIVKSLSREERNELLALMWFGRGDPGDFEDLVKHASEDIATSGDAPYMFSKSPVADYLKNGLKKLGNSI
jgi:hypothetical protein